MPPAPAGHLTNVTVSGTQFLNNLYEGAYFEKLSNANFNSIIVTDNGTGNASPAGFDINLKYGGYSNINFNTATFTGNGTGTTSGNGLTIKGRNDAPSYNSNPGSLNGVSITNVTISGSPNDLAIGNNVTGITLSGVVLNDGGYGLVYYGTTPDTVSLGDTTFNSALTGYVLNESANPIDATLRNLRLCRSDRQHPGRSLRRGRQGPGRRRCIGPRPGAAARNHVYVADSSESAPRAAPARSSARHRTGRYRRYRQRAGRAASTTT